jgi:septum formation protein
MIVMEMPMPDKTHPTIILASNSPRRRELLHQIGLSFATDPSQVDEQVLIGESPESYAVRVALDKARAAAARAGSGIIIAADTIVVLGGRILGKPANRRDAERMLSILSGKMHVVITGLAIMDASEGKTETGMSLTRVWFKDLSKDEISSYIKGGEPLDKAGAYGIQGKGALFVKQIEGCYFNVVGLPLSLLGELLHNFNIKLF